MRVYSQHTDAKVFASEHFRVREFCKGCSSDAVFIDENLLELLEKIRDHFGKPVIITTHGGYRDAAQNKVSGGSTYSQHMYGRAADIKITSVSPEKVADYARELMPTSGGVGRYRTFTHVDVKPGRARNWRG